MLTRSGRELLASGKGASGTEAAWTLSGDGYAADDLHPCAPFNGLLGLSAAWREDDSTGDLSPLAAPASDSHFTVSGSDLVTNAT